MASMSNRRFSHQLRYSTLAVALGICVAAGTVNAQSTTGNIFGNAGPGGGTVSVQNLDTGANVSTTVDASGRYTLNALPIGRYRVTLQRDGSDVSSRDNVQVLVGRGTEVGFAGGTGGETTLETVTVVGGSLHQIDVSQIESRTVITKAEMDRLPLAKNLSQIALLAPGVVQGDSRYAGRNGATLPSFSGSSQSENAYYINGYPVINPLTNVGFTELPFNAISQIQLSTSGYGVEYGRATGGVVNVITNSGTNEWKAGGQFVWRPENLSSSPKNIYYGPNDRPSTDVGGAGRIFQYRKENKFDRKTLSAYVGGPIVKDRLFFYAAAEMVRDEGEGTRNAADVTPSAGPNVNNALLTGWNQNDTDVPRWLAKIDWAINDNHRIELTGFQDRIKSTDAYSGFDYRNDAYTHDEVQRGGLFTDDNNRVYVANYTGYFTDDFTVTAMYGRSKFEHASLPFNYDPSCPRVTSTGVPAGINPTSCQSATAALLIPGANDETEGYRLNLEYRLGNHTLHLGYDYADVVSVTGSQTPGGALWTYQQATDPNEPLDAENGVGAPAAGGGFGTDGYYVTRNIFIGRSDLEVEQKAQYIKDVWQVTDNVLLELGVRNEQFANFNSAGQAFAKKDSQIAPRLGATWDVYGDSTFKVFANAGRYHLAMPPNVAFRGADGVINTTEYFTYTGTDPRTGAPTGLTSLGPVTSANNEFGLPKDPLTVAASDLRSHYQDSFAFGIEKNLGAFNVGAKLSFTTLGSAIDDFCDYRPFEKWAARNGYAPQDHEDPNAFANTFGCALFNPGEANTFNQDYDNDGILEHIELTKEDLGYPELKRTYSALDLFFERPFDGTWYLRADYTFSKNRGNAEGQLLSDLGQQDVSQTQNFDFPEIMQNAYGYLPNDRRHQIKLLGYYQFTPEWLVSGNLQYASGRPLNCLGGYAGADRDENPATAYGSSFFSCDGVTTPRGTYGSLPETFRLDLGVRYTPVWAKGFSFSADIFNVLDRQVPQNIFERRNQGTSVTTTRQDWARVISYSEPRSMQFTVRYDWGQSN